MQKNMPKLQTVKTLLHKLTHSGLHSEDALKDASDKPGRNSMEIRAESAAYMLCQMLNLPDTREEYRFPYIASYAEENGMNVIKASMTVIKGTAAGLYDRIQEELKKSA